MGTNVTQINIILVISLTSRWSTDCFDRGRCITGGCSPDWPRHMLLP